MLLSTHKIRLVALSLLMVTIGMGIISCSASKSSQCQNLFSLAEEATQKAVKLTQNGQQIDKTVWLLAADEIEESAQAMEALQLSDRTLQTYRTGFVEVYRDYAEATREIVKVLDTKDIVVAKAAQEKVRRAGEKEKELGKKINQYCQEK